MNCNIAHNNNNKHITDNNNQLSIAHVKLFSVTMSNKGIYLGNVQAIIV